MTIGGKIINISDLPVQTFISRVFAKGTTGTLGTTFLTINTTNYAGLTFNSELASVSFDPVTGELTFLKDCVAESQITFNAVGGTGGAEVQYVPEVLVSGAWSSQSARIQAVPNNADSQQVVVGARQFLTGDKIRLKVKSSVGTVELVDVPVVDSGLANSTDVPTLIWVVTLNLK